ncbi:MAG: hypothetical protein AAFY55_10560 [Bacteroidota bacterium]
MSLTTRLATTVTYIEDPDSLRFALSVADGFDLAALQPHFPGYPVFWGVAMPLFLLTGRFSVAFALVGAFATVALVGAGLALLRMPLRSVRGAAWALAVLACPLVWLMGTRYMPDLLGLAVALATVACVLHALESRKRSYALAAGLLAGVLAGLRLSYVPFVVPPLLALAVRSRQSAPLIAAGLVSVAVWLVPLIAGTGWTPLVDAASQQTVGHFTEFGGTVYAEDAGLGLRLVHAVESVWADGLGGWWLGRHLLTGFASASLLIGLVAGTRTVVFAAHRSARARHTLIWLAASAVTYGVWMVLFQNVIYKSRHALPLIALVLLVVAVGWAQLWQKPGRYARVRRWAVALGYGAVATVAITLAVQHRQPSAIAQATTHLHAFTAGRADLHIVTTPLVRYTLASQGVEAIFLDPSLEADRGRLALLQDVPVVSVGAPLGAAIGEGWVLAEANTFYHNPYVNRMWAALPVYVYAPSHNPLSDA